MRSKTSPAMQVVKREEKESKIRQFIQNSLSLLHADGAGASCLLLARSIDSPVARVLAEVIGSGLASNVTVRTIVTTADLAHLDVRDVVMNSVAALGESRIARDLRVLEAHEQLVIGANAVWIGDCMRRDPSKRDAYECYADNSGDMAVTARRSFERLWKQALPAAPARSHVTSAASDEPLADMAAGALSTESSPPPSAATRH